MARFHDAHITFTLASICAATALLTGCQDLEPAAADEPEEVAHAEQAIAGAMPFGTMCQADFQNGYETTLPYTWNRCGGFNNELNQIATQNFYYNLVGAKPYIENTWDAWVADSVPFFYLGTHGGAWSGTAVYSMWDQSTYAYTSAMRFDALTMFSGYACKTLQLDDPIGRWYPAMAGGLSIVAGSHGYLYDSYWTDDTGADYAENLSYQWSVKDAWIDGLWDAYTTQDVALLAAGSNLDDCNWRLHGINPYNWTSYPRRHDWEIGYMCWSYITE
jgi:hypothetical protein